MTTHARRNIGLAAIAAVPMLYLGYFFAYPVVTITLRGLAGSDTGSGLVTVLTDPAFLDVARFTVLQAVLSTAITVALAMPAAWAFATFEFPGKRFLRAMTLVPFVLPTLVVGTAFLTLAGPSGILGVDLTGTLGIILAAHVFYNYAVVVRGVGSYWERIDPSLEQAARTLGASPFRAFRTVTLRLLTPAIVSTSALVFLFSFTSFGVILLLGDLRHSTIEVEIWRQTTTYLRLDVASVLAVAQLVGIGGILWAYGAYQRRTTVQLATNVRAARRPTGRGEWIAVGAVVTSMALVVATPLAVLVLRSLRQPSGGYGLENFLNIWRLPADSAAFIDPAVAVRNSFGFALTALALAVVIGTIAAAMVTRAPRRAARAFDIFVMLPLGTSAVTIGFGFLVALDEPIDLRTSLLLIPIAHSLVGIPFVVRTISPAIGAVRHDLREAAATLGAAPWRVWWSIDARLVGTAILAAAAFAFAISMGEFGATAFIARPTSPTIPIAIFRLLGRPGAVPFGGAVAMSVILMAVTGGAIAIIDAIGTRTRSEL